MTSRPSKRKTEEIQKESREVEDEYDFAKKAEEVAKERGLVVVLPKANRLQIDIDSQAAYSTFLDRLTQFGIGIETCRIVPSASGLPCRHVTIIFKDEKFTESERIALQFALGSDPVRERLNMMRLWFGVANPTRLFERPVDANPA